MWRGNMDRLAICKEREIAAMTERYIHFSSL